ncbi:ubiquitin carboxyl-terminal hydrolase L5 [Coniosporium apollinis CBS 100218]|uniref:Ubiquitin carboxyl-terminal hydrolase n=1 Tax=Coniosporium apollinis (strain CBS 100218) TaxID=1168221 RepID=R7YKP6_CONA1|nr:ubiquitin carboxyl-terminal hydrolase L5 [Coniosporium apollinis CBS 100218]EON62191.1 ubiquitin carboxyl-terminal hydrolase L5 [Coniosporium apollinis CBS 100218]
MSGGWNTIESDAGVFTELLEKLGAKDVQFEELISLDADLLRQLSPVYGVIFLFKYPTGEPPSSVPKDGTFDHSAAENIFFAAQTIQNACGTQALLSVLLNKDGEIDIGSPLRDFKEFTTAFPADLRGEALSNSDLIRETHNSFARSSPFISDESRTATADDDVYHFIAYTAINNVLYELDGLQAAPISHGPCAGDEFPDKVIPVLQRRIERYPPGEIRFNLLAVCRDLRARAREVGDEEGLRREESKRVEWAWENALRRHNFVGFVGELVKGVVRAKLKEGEGAYEEWVKEAVERSRKRREEGRRKGDGRDEMEV